MKKIIFLIVLSFIFCALNARAQSFNKEMVCFIDSGKKASDTIDTQGRKLASIVFADSLDSTAVVIYTATSTDSTFYPIQYDGSDLSLTFADNKVCGFKPQAVNQCERYVYFQALKNQTRKRWFKVILTTF